MIAMISFVWPPVFRLKQTQAVVAGKTETQWAVDGFGEAQSPETAEAVGLVCDVFVAVTPEVDGFSRSIAADVDGGKCFGTSRLGQTAIAALAADLIFRAEALFHVPRMQVRRNGLRDNTSLRESAPASVAPSSPDAFRWREGQLSFRARRTVSTEGREEASLPLDLGRPTPSHTSARMVGRVAGTFQEATRT